MSLLSTKASTCSRDLRSGSIEMAESGDLCKGLRERYDKCFQDFLDNVYFKQPVKGPFTPCSEDLNVYHDCLRKDPKKAEYFAFVKPQEVDNKPKAQ